MIDFPIEFDDDDAYELVSWLESVEPGYSHWYDRNPDSEMPDNYPEAVDPEDFAPPYEEDIHDEDFPTDYDDDDDYAIGWLESAIDEVNYEQDHL